ncbi:hypothetical protein P43SY_000037 [Pythium insidiosum]|uniref:PX domain-containing protein n=1 Tax=Pythium insidiosum TaxID=114742 RepID=A0AAD5LJK1_PYTIN|nr:hypothetical protein P43SY_000037 [Pythium insidiosum]
MSSGRSILRDVHVAVVAVEARAARHESTAYVFAVQPRLTRNQLIRSSLQNARQSTTSALSWSCSPTVHRVRRTFSQCRQLYRELLAYTSCAHSESCCCLLGACPFWNMARLLEAFPFPHKTLLKLETKELHRQRLQALNRFMAVVFQSLHSFRDDFFLDRASTSEVRGCKVIDALEEFLDVTDDVVRRVREVDVQLQFKLNLQGWQSDRKRLYFRDHLESSECVDDDTQARTPEARAESEKEDRRRSRWQDLDPASDE